MKNYPHYTVDKYESYKDFIRGIGEKYKDSPAITCYGGGTALTRSYSQLMLDVEALGEGLIAGGYAGKHIAILAENSYMWLVALFAVTCIGGIAVPIDIEQSAEAAVGMILYADSAAVFVSESTAELAAEAELPLLRLDGEGEDSAAAYIEAGQKLISGGEGRFSGLKLDPAQDALIVYTSGTTSTAKAVRLSHRALIKNAYESVMLVDIPRRVFTSLPLYHTYGLTCSVVNNLLGGAHICLNGDIKYMQRDLDRFKPRTVMAVPLIAEMLLKRLDSETDKQLGNVRRGPLGKLLARLGHGALSRRVKNKLLPALELIICGGAHMPESVADAFEKYGVLVLHGYGITECSPLVTVNRNKANYPSTVGFPLPGWELKLEDDELLVRGDCLMNGYYKNEKLTSEAIIDGWFHTGDLAEIDAKGCVRINGRVKNLIVLKNGKKISPEELEGYFHDIPMVGEVMAYGSSVGGERDSVIPAVTVYPDPSATAGMSAYEILQALQHEVDGINADLPSYKQIQLINIRDNEFDKTSIKKIKRS